LGFGVLKNRSQPLGGLLSSRSGHTYQQFVRSLTVQLAATKQNVIRACVRRWSPQHLQAVALETAWFPLSSLGLTINSLSKSALVRWA
jgi:hypothetical protein